MITGVKFFHEDFPDPEAAKKNIEKYLSKNTDYTFINNDFRKINYESIGKHNVYLFDGPHHYEDHFEGVKITQPALSEKYIFIVDDWNWDQVRRWYNCCN